MEDNPSSLIQVTSRGNPWNNGKEVPRARHGDTAANHTDLQSGCGQTYVFAVQLWSNLWDLIWLRTSHYSMIDTHVCLLLMWAARLVTLNIGLLSKVSLKENSFILHWSAERSSIQDPSHHQHCLRPAAQCNTTFVCRAGINIFVFYQ